MLKCNIRQGGLGGAQNFLTKNARTKGVADIYVLVHECRYACLGVTETTIALNFFLTITDVLYGKLLELFHFGDSLDIF